MRIDRGSEEGMAMVVALLVSVVLLLLSIVVVQQSIHDVTSSAYDRQRLTSVNAAESGGNYYYAYLQSTTVDAMTCAPTTQTIASAPRAASFTATPTFYDANGDVMPCASATPFSSTYYPSSVLIDSVGTVDGQTPRRMQTYVRLTPVYGGFGAAVLTNNGADFPNNFDIYGNNGNDGDVYILNGDLKITNTPHIRGNVNVPNGGATISGNSNILGNLWANLGITLNNPATVTGNVISSTGSIGGSGAISGNATAGTTISGVSLAGTPYPNTISPKPPTQPFPQITFNSADWSGYNIQTFTGANACTAAYSYVTGGTWSTDTVVRITGSTPCTFNVSNNTTVNVNANLAIITDWGINFLNQSNWNGATSTKSLFFISTWPDNGCPDPTGSFDAVEKTVATANNTNFNSYVQAFFYSPCKVSMNNTSNFAGQVLGGTVQIGNQFTMSFRPVLVPGYGTITSFREDIAYVREVS
jgi:hypothetical protein